MGGVIAWAHGLKKRINDDDDGSDIDFESLNDRLVRSKLQFEQEEQEFWSMMISFFSFFFSSSPY